MCLELSQECRQRWMKSFHQQLPPLSLLFCSSTRIISGRCLPHIWPPSNLEGFSSTGTRSCMTIVLHSAGCEGLSNLKERMGKRRTLGAKSWCCTGLYRFKQSYCIHKGGVCADMKKQSSCSPVTEEKPCSLFPHSMSQHGIYGQNCFLNCY